VFLCGTAGRLRKAGGPAGRAERVGVRRDGRAAWRSKGEVVGVGREEPLGDAWVGSAGRG
jgi:hypothetical protein